MATIFLSNAKAFLPSLQFTSSSSALNTQKIVCKAGNEPTSIVISRRSIAAATATFLLGTLSGYKSCFEKANAAILEADDDEELLEKVKKDRKKRLEKQGVIKSATKETELISNAY